MYHHFRTYPHVPSAICFVNPHAVKKSLCAISEAMVLPTAVINLKPATCKSVTMPAILSGQSFNALLHVKKRSIMKLVHHGIAYSLA